MATLSLIFYIFSPVSGYAQEVQAIGRVLSTTGSVTARGLSGALRELSRRSDIFIGDTVITGPNGFAQIRMVDSAQISFKEDTEFTFYEYSSDGPGGAADSALMEMVRGGFRTISGTIGDDSADVYQVSTRFANIGIRGTTHEAVIDAGALLTGVYDGGTTISNGQGSLDTGEGTNFDYTQTFPGQAPQGLLQQPAQLGRININAAAAGVNDSDDDGDDGEDGDGNDDGNDNGSDGDVDGDGDANNNDGGNDNNNEGDGNDGVAGANNEEAGGSAPTNPPGNNPASVLAGPGNTNLDPTGDESRTTETAVNPANNIREVEEFEETGVGSIAGVLSTADNARISDRIGFVLSRNAAPGVIFPGNVTELNAGQEVILAGNDLSSPFTLDSEPPYIFRAAGSFISLTDGTITESGERPYDFEIGVWGGSSNPISLFSDFTDKNVFKQIEDPLFVVSVDPAPLSSLTGSVIYLSNFDRFLGGSSAGALTNFLTVFNVNFSTSLITDGAMEFCLGGESNCSGSNAQFWRFNYTGEVVNGFVVASPVNNQGYINDEPASIFGFIDGVFTGANAEGFVGGFNLFYDDDLDVFRNSLNSVGVDIPDTTVDGVFLDVFRNSLNSVGVDIPDTTVDGVFLIEKELRLSKIDFDQSLGDDAFLIQESYARNLLGYSQETANSSILFLDRRSRPRLIIQEGDYPISISQVNQGLAPTISEAFSLNWERWKGPLLTLTDNLDDSIVQDGALDEIDDVAFFATFDISEMTDITGRYENVLAFMGENSEGARISDIVMSFDINFSASTAMNNIENGKMFINVASHDTEDESWLIFFEGGLSRNMVDFNLLSSNPSDSSELAGIYLVNPLTATPEFDNNLDSNDSNMKGVILNDYNISSSPRPALLSSFFFRETLGSSPRRSVTGLALTLLGLEPDAGTLPDLRFDNPDIESGGILKSDLVNLGIAVVGNPGGVSTRIGRETIDYIYPVFGSNTTSKQDRAVLGQFTPTYSASNPYNLSLERVLVNENDSTYTDTFVRNVGGYNVTWGIWDSPGSSINGLFAYTDAQDLNSNENDFATMPWLLVNNPQITSYDGTATYTHITEFLGGNDSEEIASMFTAFDVDFTTAMVSNGFLDVKTDAGNLWESDFSGAISGGFLNSTSLSGSFTPYLSTYSFAISGEIAGVFTGLNDNDPSAPYNAFAGGFNFTKDGSETSYFLSGLFLAEREARLNSSELFQMQRHLGLIVDKNSVSFGLASHPSSYAGGASPSVAINDRGNQTITKIDNTGPFDEVLTGTSSTVVQSSNIMTDMGYWESENMSIMHNQFDASQLAALSQDMLWANPEPTDISSRTGTVVYADTGEFLGLSSISGEIDLFNMSFDMNFDTTTVTNGILQVGNTSENELWNAVFTGGNINGSFVEFTGINGDFSNSTLGISCLNCITGQIKGVFTEDTSFYGDGFTTGFSLSNSGSGSGLMDAVFGIGVLNVVYK